MFIIDGKKVFKPDLIKKQLTLEGLAYWVMCDGSLNKSKGYITLHTEGFDSIQVQQISLELNEKFGLQTHMLQKKNYKNLAKDPYYIIYIPKKDVQSFSNQKKYYNVFKQISSMHHKLPNDVKPYL